MIPGNSADLAELAAIVRALRHHVEWLGDTYPVDVPAADEQWLERRRDEYRAYAAQPAEPELAPVPTEPLLALSIPTIRSGSEDVAIRGPSPAPPTPEVAAVRSVASTAAADPVALAGRSPAPGAQSPVEPEARSAEVATPAPPRSVKPANPAPALARLPLTDPSLEPRRRLEILAEHVRGCTACELHQTRTQTVFARGTGSSGLVFVGEGPGADEDAQGLPFVGKAGQLLDRMIEAMGFQREEVYVCNIVKCRPPDNRKPEPREMDACRGYLMEQLEAISPKVIVALGATAVQGLLGLTMGITRLRGQWRLYRGVTPVMPTFHPAFLLRQPAAKREVWQDLQAVLEHLGRKPR